MIVTAMPLTEITRSAIHLLCQEMGVVNTARFINQFTTGYGNYTEECDALFADITVDAIITEIKRKRTPPT